MDKLVDFKEMNLKEFTNKNQKEFFKSIGKSKKHQSKYMSLSDRFVEEEISKVINKIK